jgi:hypothetical protein
MLILFSSSASSSSPSADSFEEEVPVRKKPKLSRKSIAEVLEAKTANTKEIRMRELELEERRMKLQEDQQREVFTLLKTVTSLMERSTPK